MKIIALLLLSLSIVSCSGIKTKIASTAVEKRVPATEYPSFGSGKAFQDLLDRVTQDEENDIVASGKVPLYFTRYAKALFESGEQQRKLIKSHDLVTEIRSGTKSKRVVAYRRSIVDDKISCYKLEKVRTMDRRPLKVLDYRDLDRYYCLTTLKIRK